MLLLLFLELVLILLNGLWIWLYWPILFEHTTKLIPNIINIMIQLRRSNNDFKKGVYFTFAIKRITYFYFMNNLLSLVYI